MSALNRQWAELKGRLVRDLEDAGLTGDDAALCRWQGERLRTDRPLSGEEREQARRLVHALRGHGRLDKRLRRVLAGSMPVTRPGRRWPSRLAAAEADEEATQDRVGRVKRDLDDLGRDLALGAAVAAAAASLGPARPPMRPPQRT
ncbi:hypothetical protein [Amycolatopsis sp. NPDC051061]|uniref:hypothetical protein n=1 Tax=Amycolatopsis sp. NPDC051061 TaxID=3155042 RepID=UPI0034264659